MCATTPTTHILVITTDPELQATFSAWFAHTSHMVSTIKAARAYLAQATPQPYLIMLDTTAKVTVAQVARLHGDLGETCVIVALANEPLPMEWLGAQVVDIWHRAMPPDLLRHRIQQVLYWLARARAIPLPEGAPTAETQTAQTLGYELDVLERALRKEQELRQIKHRFMTMATHEFRTPLMVIAAASEMLMTFGVELTQAEQQQQLTRIRDYVQQLKRTLSEIETQIHDDFLTLDYNPSQVDLVALCHEVIAISQDDPRYAHTITFVSNRPVCLALLDRPKIAEILEQLLSNAMKFSPPDTTIQVQLACEDSGATLHVRDEGIGIPAEELPRVFDLFFQGSNIGAIGGKGKGVGLKLVQDYVHVHHGRIYIESRVNAGTTVTIHLPLRPEREVQ